MRIPSIALGAALVTLATLNAVALPGPSFGQLVEAPLLGDETAAWRFNNPNPLADDSGNGNGLANESPAPSYESTPLREFAQVSGSSARAEPSLTLSALGSGSITASFWIRGEATDRHANVLMKRAHDCGDPWAFQVVTMGSNHRPAHDAGQIAFSQGTGTNGVISNATVMSGLWTHVTFVRDVAHEEVRVYVNGTLDARSAADARDYSNAGPFHMARDLCDGATLVADLDDVRLFGRALSNHEIAVLATLPPAALSSLG